MGKRKQKNQNKREVIVRKTQLAISGFEDGRGLIASKIDQPLGAGQVREKVLLYSLQKDTAPRPS